MDQSPLKLAIAAGLAGVAVGLGLRVVWKRDDKPKIVSTKRQFDSVVLVLSVQSYLDPKTILRNDELLTQAVRGGSLFVVCTCQNYSMN